METKIWKSQKNNQILYKKKMNRRKKNKNCNKFVMINDIIVFNQKFSFKYLTDVAVLEELYLG